MELHTKKSIKSVSPALYSKLVLEKADYVILVLAEPRLGVNVLDTMHKLK